MSKYGDTAILAVKFLNEGVACDPRDAWAQATKIYFPKSKSSQKKGCPKCTFLGLCNKGLIKGVPPGEGYAPRRNKDYVIKAIDLLREDPSLSSSSRFLWGKITDNIITHNQQMDVIVALWNESLINK